MRVEKDDTLLILTHNESEYTYIPLKNLEEWRGWSEVERGVKPLLKVSPLTSEEVDIIKSCAVTPSGINGLNEFLSFLAHTK